MKKNVTKDFKNHILQGLSQLFLNRCPKIKEQTGFQTPKFVYTTRFIFKIYIQFCRLVCYLLPCCAIYYGEYLPITFIYIWYVLICTHKTSPPMHFHTVCKYVLIS